MSTNAARARTKALISMVARVDRAQPLYPNAPISPAPSSTSSRASASKASRQVLKIWLRRVTDIRYSFELPATARAAHCRRVKVSIPRVYYPCTPGAASTKPPLLKNKVKGTAHGAGLSSPDFDRRRGGLLPSARASLASNFLLQSNHREHHGSRAHTPLYFPSSPLPPTSPSPSHENLRLR
jgi:hypothetical protein